MKLNQIKPLDRLVISTSKQSRASLVAQGIPKTFAGSRVTVTQTGPDGVSFTQRDFTGSEPPPDEKEWHVTKLNAEVIFAD